MHALLSNARLACRTVVLLLVLHFSTAIAAGGADSPRVGRNVEGDLLLLPSAGSTVLVNGTDLLQVLATVATMRSELDALRGNYTDLLDVLETTQQNLNAVNKSTKEEVELLQAENKRLNHTIQLMSDAVGYGTDTASLLLGLPLDLGNFTRRVLKMQGAGEEAVNGYYTQLPGKCKGFVCFSKILGPELLRKLPVRRVLLGCRSMRLTTSPTALSNTACSL